MPDAIDHQPLSDDECERLGRFLETTPARRNLEWIDGYFAALICGPEFVMPSQGLDEILGEDVVFDSQDQAGEVIGLLMRHWNTIAAELRRSLADKQHVYLPVLFEDDAGLVRGNDWAKGFMRGVQTRPGSWREFIDSEEHGGWVIPMMMLACEDDPELDMRPPPIADDKREDIITHMVAGLAWINRHLEPVRRQRSTMPASLPVRRRAPKVGRNDPCPCGSGRKYKHCCAASLH